MGQPGYTLPWGTQINAAAMTQARLTEARQREQRASEEQSILLREGADMGRYYEHRAEECRTSMAAAAADAPVDIPFSEPGMAAAAVSYWLAAVPSWSQSLARVAAPKGAGQPENARSSCRLRWPAVRRQRHDHGQA